MRYVLLMMVILCVLVVSTVEARPIPRIAKATVRVAVAPIKLIRNRKHKPALRLMKRMRHVRSHR